MLLFFVFPSCPVGSCAIEVTKVMQKEMRDRVDSRVEGIGDVDFVAAFADDRVDGI